MNLGFSQYHFYVLVLKQKYSIIWYYYITQCHTSFSLQIFNFNFFDPLLTSETHIFILIFKWKKKMLSIINIMVEKWGSK